MIQNSLLSGIGKRLPGLLSSIFIVFIGITLAKVTWYFFTPINTTTPAPLLLKNNQINREKKINYGDEIAQKHVFGQLPEAEKSTVVVKQQVLKVKPKIALTIKLHGVVSTGDLNSYAILSGTGKAGQHVFDLGQSVLFINDKEVKDVILKNVFSNYIVIDNRGVEEKIFLPLYENELDLTANAKGIEASSSVQKKMLAYNPAGTPQYVAQTANKQSQGLFVNGNKSTEYDKGSSHAISANKKITGEQLVVMREEILSNPNKILDIVSVSEAKDKEGKFLGFRLSPGKKRNVFRALNLRAGDIVINVNGVQLDSPQRGFEVMNQLATSSSIRLTIKRGQQEFTITRNLPN